MCGILMVEMLKEAFLLFFFIVFWIMTQPILYRTTEYVHWLKISIGFGYNLAINATWRM